MAAKVVLFIVSAVLVQNAYSQWLNGIGARTYSGLNLDVEAISSGYNGLSGYTNNYGLINNGLGLANYGLINNGVGLANYGYNGLGLANVGLVDAGFNYNYNYNNYGINGLDLIGYPNLNGIGSSGPLPVTTISPIGPSGLAVASENEIGGYLQVGGSLPFLSAVAFEGVLPTAGSGVAKCGCGNGAVGILNEGFPAGPIGPIGYPGYVGIGNGIGGIYY